MSEQKQYTFEELEAELKQSHRDFAREYFVNGWNRVKAYMKVYPDSSYQAAAVSANEILKNPKIEQFINYLKEDLEKACNINKARNLIELSKIAYSSIAHLHNTWIERKEFEQLTEDQKSAIESIDTKTVTVNFDDQTKEVEYVKIKLYSKTEAIKMINEMMGYKTADKIEHSGTIKTVDLSQLSTEELLLRAKAANKLKEN